MSRAEKLAEQFHTIYEELAPSFSYKTRKASAVPWKDVPEQNKRLMIAVVEKAMLPEIERLLADEREKGHIEGHTCGDSIIEIDEDGKVKGCAYKIRQLDLTAPSSTEEG